VEIALVLSALERIQDQQERGGVPAARPAQKSRQLLEETPLAPETVAADPSRLLPRFLRAAVELAELTEMLLVGGLPDRLTPAPIQEPRERDPRAARGTGV
jgi:hypothetical protein